MCLCIPVELASLLSRNVSYEGPALRRQLAKAQQLQQELSRREVECQSSAADLRERYYAACKQYGITGENVPRELQALVKDLPAVLDEVGKDAARLEEQIQLYAAFTNFVCDCLSVQDPGSGAELLSLRLPHQDPGSGGIDWGDSAEAPIEIEIVDVGTDCPEGVARGEDALTVLENPQSRSRFIDQLMELEVFLTQRLTEMREEGDVVAMSQFQQAPSVIQGQTCEHIQAMLSEVQDLLGRLTSLRMQHLFMIHASPRYVERVSEMLRQKMKQADILVLKGATMAEKRQEALQEQSRLEPRVDLLAGCTRELQKLIEADISKRYHNRPVNLMGVNI
ncbi:CDK5 regulatory subunit-associated protein 3-like [Neolamprologus brichardi]|uniref:CDK5 regulatory subunit-associated protein 3-like n=1 Tax=Neolamprologus brichardi TaxID=32507 RepID=UPI001643F575|nr:CDK5 regulatory subunit-associated protein 3-like [Neolamprologus brichardi]